MKTQINGIEITPKMAAIFEKWYGDAISYDDTLPFAYVSDLGRIQDFLCRNITDSSISKDVLAAIEVIISIKDDLSLLIPDKDSEMFQKEVSCE